MYCGPCFYRCEIQRCKLVGLRMRILGGATNCGVGVAQLVTNEQRRDRLLVVEKT